MRYIMLLSVVTIIGILIYVQFTSPVGFLSPQSKIKYQDVQPAVDDMQRKIDNYNTKMNDSIESLNTDFD